MTEWFYRLDGVNQGPVSEADLKHIFDSRALPLTTAVWREGMDDWVEAGKMKTFCAQPIAIPAIVNAAQISASPTTSSFLSAKRIALVVCICIAGFGLWELKNKLAKTSRSASYENHQVGSASPSSQSSATLRTDNNSSGLKLDPQDRDDIRNGRLPAAIRYEAKMGGIDEGDLLSYLNNVQAQIQNTPYATLFMKNDGEVFWGVVYNKLLEAITIVQSTPKEEQVPNESVFNHFKITLKRQLSVACGINFTF